MILDKRIILIIAEAAIIMVLAIVMMKEEWTAPTEDPYLQQLKQQNQELAEQLARLKLNYIEIGLADSLQTRNMDSLITVSNKKISGLREEAQTYRAALEEMKTREWKKLNDAQKTKEINEALNFLQSNEKQK